MVALNLPPPHAFALIMYVMKNNTTYLTIYVPLKKDFMKVSRAPLPDESIPASPVSSVAATSTTPPGSGISKLSKKQKSYTGAQSLGTPCREIYCIDIILIHFR